jgi:hypothetical protein
MEENERLRVGVSERHTAGRRHSLVGLLGLPCRGDRQELQTAHRLCSYTCSLGTSIHHSIGHSCGINVSMIKCRAMDR